MKSLRCLLLCCLLPALAVANRVGETSGGAAKLKPSDLAKLKKSKLRVLLPTDVPAGFSVTNFTFEDNNKEPLTSVLFITYSNKKGGEITVQMASDGIGSPIFDDEMVALGPQKSLMARSPILGKVQIDYIRTKRGYQFHCEWVELGKNAPPRVAMIYGHGVDPAVGKRLLESLRFLRKR
jgi:hypothetical protein